MKRAKSSQAAREQERAVHFFEHPTEDLVEVRATLLPEEAAALRKALELGIKAPSSRPLVPGGAGSSLGQAVDSAAAELPRERFGLADALVFLAESFLANPGTRIAETNLRRPVAAGEQRRLGTCGWR
ncbi:MAG: hypothetical protein JKY65_03895 [Planctomycetes bacterium]|nr:hypothetical protein [Planctomycetota bacterium]